MLNKIIFLSIIVKLAFGEEYSQNDVVMNLDLLDALSGISIDESDELTPIEAEIQKTCMEITKKDLCLKATSKLGANGVGLILKKKPNEGNDEPGGCVYIPDPNNEYAKRLGNQCLSPAAVKKLRRRLKRKGVIPDDDQSILAKQALLSATNDAQFDINYIIATIAIIGLLITFGVYYKCTKKDVKQTEIIKNERTSLYQSV